MAATFHSRAPERQVDRSTSRLGGLAACVALAAFVAGSCCVPDAGAADSRSGPKGTMRVPSRHGEATDLNAAKVDVDYRTQRAVLRKVTISQGELTVTADRAEATGLNFDDSRWTFEGDVHITSEREGKLLSDRAIVEFRNDRMQSALATGHPAEFEQTSSKTGVLARGHANTIEYTVATDTVRLTENAWLQYGDDQIGGPVLVYDIREQRLQGASVAGPSGRVHLTVLPKKRTKPASPSQPAPRRP